MKKPVIEPNCIDCKCKLSLSSFTPAVQAHIMERGLRVQRCPKCILAAAGELINEVEDCPNCRDDGFSLCDESGP